MNLQTRKYIGAIFLPLRLVGSWLFLSAAHRRLILAPEKHQFLSEEWLGHKINTFYPHSNGFFNTALEYLVQNPVHLDIFTWVFTISELILGVLLLLGVVSRFTGLFLVGMAVGLMHTSGWLGPTCLDEWQIASLLVTSGLMLALYGGGSFTLDSWLMKRHPDLNGNRWWRLVAVPDFKVESKGFKRLAYGAAILVFVYVIGMNQVHHGGLWGPLHNYSKKPGIELSELKISSNDSFAFTAFRDKGPEAYGSFIIKVDLLDEKGNLIHRFDDHYLKNMDTSRISNINVNRVKPGANSLVIPLGAEAELKFNLPDDKTLNPAGNYKVVMTEIGGRSFEVALE
ncbi:MAG: hypothetical protein K9J21_12310 [Bacteroidales bacterium]|nr:hypothetical protein [Bacteroidales bacterium]